MKRRYTNVQHLTEEIFRRKQNGETNREIGEVFGLTKRQIEQLVNRENRRRKAIANGYIPRPKGRPRKTAQTEMELKSNEIVRLKMQVELLRNFLSEVGRR